MKLILASQSPRRKQILKDAAFDFQIEIAATNEAYPSDLDCELIPEFIAKEKAEVVVGNLKSRNEWLKGTVVLAADTIVVLNGKIIGKPKDEADATHILQQLSGKIHEVITGVYIKTFEEEYSFHSLTKVEFNHLSSAQIDYYIQNYKPFDKAGAYAIQEWIGMIGVAKIEGDLYNVIGLPINKVARLLNEIKG
ncbi:MAG TPA: Maf family nucleotide pyrophosphatase [Edaphocola sp.]|nr:Maf family nucleotide pyrophosphatase [Edaphocola sp.]